MNRFPTHGLQYKDNPDQSCNMNGYKLLDTLNRYKLFVLNGIVNEAKSYDSKFTCIRPRGSSQVDLALSNKIEYINDLKIHEKLIQSDHCAMTIDISIRITPSMDIINECASGTCNYEQYDFSKRIKQSINIKNLNLGSNQVDLTKLGEYLSTKYLNMSPTQITIDECAQEITNKLYTCCKNNYNKNSQTNLKPHQENCTSKNFKAIAEAHKHRYENILDNPELSDYHKQEWLFYQAVAWQKEEEELYINKNEKWKSCSPQKVTEVIGL